MHREAERLRRDYSIHYPSISANHWGLLLPFTDAEHYQPLRNHYLRRLGSKRSFEKLGQAYLNDLKRNALRTNTQVISAEQFMHADRQALLELRSYLSNLKLQTKILVYVRHPAERLSSNICQWLRAGRANLDTYPLEDRTTPVLRTYEAIFGKENLIVRRFGQQYFLNYNLLDDFTSVINGSPIPGMQQTRLNESISHSGVLFGEYSYAVAPLNSGARGKDEYIRAIPGPKFIAPRWMVEKTLEQHLDGINYLANEFGIRFDEIDLSIFPDEIDRTFPPEALTSLAQIMNDQSLEIESLNRRIQQRRFRSRLKKKIRRLIGGRD
jgi:hypothetical protein